MQSTRRASRSMLMLAAAMAGASVHVGGFPGNPLEELEKARAGLKPKKREPAPRKIWYTVDSPEVIAATKQFKEKHCGTK